MTLFLIKVCMNLLLKLKTIIKQGGAVFTVIITENKIDKSKDINLK